MAASPALVPEGSNRRLRPWLLRLALGLSVLGFLVWKTEWAPLLALFRGMEPGGWCLALLLYAGVQMGLSSSRWRLLAEPLGFRAPWRHYFTLYYIGLFFNLFLPTSMGGDVVRAWTLAETKDRRVKAFLSVVSDRLSGLLALVLLACLATLLFDQPLPAWIRLTVWGLAAGMILGYALLPVLAKRSPKLLSVAHALSVSRGHRWRWAVALGLSLLVQSASVAQIALMGEALGLRVPLLGYAVVVPLVSLLTMLPISVGGMGVREGSLLLLLAPFGVSGPEAVGLGLSWLAMNLVMGLGGGLVYLFRRPHRLEEPTPNVNRSAAGPWLRRGRARPRTPCGVLREECADHGSFRRDSLEG